MKRFMVKVYRGLGVESIAHAKARVRNSIKQSNMHGIKSIKFMEGNRHAPHY